MVDGDNLSDAIMAHGAAHPARLAVVEGDARLSWAKFAALVRQCAAWLRGRGLSEDDRVGLALPNSTDHLILHFALLRAGVTVLEIPQGADLAGLANRYRLRAVFTASGAPDAGVKTIVIEAAWRDAIAATPGDGRTVRPGSACLQVALTSGSTGSPRAIACTHAQRLARAAAYQEVYRDRWSPERPADFLLTMEICHSGFMQFLINQIRIGGAIFVLPHFHAPADFVAAVVAARDAVVVATPDMCRALLAAAPADAPLLPGLRALISVGLPLYAGEKRQLAARVTPFLYDAFGAAGFGMIAALPPHEVAAMAETVGRSPAGAVVEVVDAAGGPLPPGVSGHLRCAGPTMAQGWLAPEDAGLSPAEAFSGGYYYSGDIASIDAAGYITLQGRRADVIRRAGAEIFPLEIEARMAAHAGVRDVAVVGRAGPGGEEIIAYVVPQGDLPHETLAAHCAQHLAPSHRPSVIYYTATLPRTGNGKLDRPALRALAARQAAL